MAEPEFLGKGLAFPIGPSHLGGLQLAAGAEKVRQSVWLILSTAPGERMMRPDFGCAVYDLLFHPNTPATRGMAAVKVREALVRWEPRIDVADVVAETAPGRRNQLLIRVDYRLRQNNAHDNLVFPFFLDEGASAETSNG